MHPVLFRIGSFTIFGYHLGPITVYTYGVLVATGVIVGLILARWQARKFGLDPDRIWNVGIYMVLIALLGSKLWLVLGDLPYYLHNPREILSFSTLQSGGDIYGGVMFGLAFLLWYVYREKLGYWAVADIFAAPLALGHSIGRLGCFSAGCCWGKPTTMPWGITFTNPLAAQLVGTPLNVKLQPTELFEAGAEFINFLLLIWLGRRRNFTGELAAAWMVLYGTERFIIEFYRNDPGRGMMFHNSFSFMQVVSLILIFIGGWMFLKHRIRRVSTVATETAQN
jgi:phosphatidylglycerol:prolipoprotein diacylglycerol transferase